MACFPLLHLHLTVLVLCSNAQVPHPRAAHIAATAQALAPCKETYIYQRSAAYKPLALTTQGTRQQHHKNAHQNVTKRTLVTTNDCPQKKI